MANPLKIAQIAPLWTRVPPEAYGGAELMVHWLTEDLVRRGHDVTLFASGDSESSAHLVSVCEDNLIDRMARRQAYNYDRYAIANMVECLKRADEFDVIHSHMGAASIPLASLCSAPMLYTIHEGLDSPDEHWLIDNYPGASIAAISHSQISTVPENRRTRIPVVYHGCEFPDQEPKEPLDYLAFIGRMSALKNPVDAITTARALDMPIRLAGTPQNREEEKYFREFVEPEIDDDRVTYLGAISQTEKSAFLAQAAAVLFPIRWEEHFGLVMIEAMACGTPVVAYRRGSVPEVIDEGISGYIGSRAEELPELVMRALKLDRDRIRLHARKRFSVERMTADYLELYRDLILRSAAGGE